MAEAVVTITITQSVSEVTAPLAEVLKRVGREDSPVIVTHLGASTALIQDAASCQCTPESLALLQVATMHASEIAKGRGISQQMRSAICEFV
jgi:hypothetical protein